MQPLIDPDFSEHSHGFDHFLESKTSRFARYADDFVIRVKSLSEGERIKTEITAYLKTLK